MNFSNLQSLARVADLSCGHDNSEKEANDEQLADKLCKVLNDLNINVTKEEIKKNFDEFQEAADKVYLRKFNKVIEKYNEK